MTQHRRARVGLLLGLIFIIAFGWFLGGLKPDGENDSTGDAGGVHLERGTIYRKGSEFITLKPEAPGPAGQENDTVFMGAVAGEQTGDGYAVRSEMKRFPENGGGGAVELIPLEPVEDDTPTPVVSPRRAVPEQPRPQRPEYVYYSVEKGDTLISIARKIYGREHGALFRNIRTANGERIPDPSGLPVGMRLRIPRPSAVRAEEPKAEQRKYREDGVPDFSRAESGGPGTKSVEVSLDELRRRVTARSGGGHRRRVYIVKKGDNLTRIARKMLGDGNSETVERLFRANRDRLDDKNELMVGMKLNIPG